MSTSTATTTPVATRGATPATGSFGRITFASMAAGTLAAAVSTFVVLPSASEARVVGGALLAFAAGWAMFASLTTRYTNHKRGRTSPRQLSPSAAPSWLWSTPVSRR